MLNSSHNPYHNMTNIIRKDKDWLKEEIECGIQGYIEMNWERLSNDIMKDVFRQLFLSACAVNMESENDEPAKLIIEIDIPIPDECAEAIDNPSIRSVLEDL